MARKLLVEHEGLRTLAIAVLMIICLLASLAMAHVLFVTGSASGLPYQRVTVGELALDVPAAWEQAPDPAADDDVQAWGSQRGELLAVVRLSGSGPRALNTALGQARLHFQPRGVRIREAPLGVSRTGAVLALSVEQQIAADPPLLQYLTVVTQDARTYYAIVVRTAVGEDARRAVYTLQAIHREVLGSLQLATLRPADADQLDAAGHAALALWQRGNRDDAYAALTATSETGDDAAYVADLSGRQLQLLRLRLMPDATNDDGPAAPAALLTSEFEMVMRTRPNRGQVSQVRIGTFDVWVTVFTDGRSDLERLIAYARLSNGQAALIEALVPRGGAGRLVTQGGVLTALLDAAERTGAAERTTASEAAARGAALARRIAADFDANTLSGDDYALIEHDGDAVGLALSRVLPRAPGGPQPIRAEAVVALTGQARRHEQWQAATDLSTLRWERGEARQRLEVIANQLILSRQTTTGHTAATAPLTLPPNYLPPIAEDHWPLDLLRSWGGEPALLWLSRGMSLPALCWVVLEENAANGRLRLRIRPVISIDEIVYWLDDAGRVTASENHLAEGQPLGGAPVLVTRVTRRQILDLDPSFAPLLNQLEQEIGPSR